ncbi:hypothetical protein HPP92_014143 [Vanilla planifolia]|uniref:Uncharacterized protein n=1 Tax=Vanilla planifolia TaxID=51239 RepID=A0A835QZ36_VANPL|nr:hypothetical protein HPP92_014143 [Vanilla planifolia]
MSLHEMHVGVISVKQQAKLHAMMPSFFIDNLTIHLIFFNGQITFFGKVILCGLCLLEKSKGHKSLIKRASSPIPLVLVGHDGEVRGAFGHGDQDCGSLPLPLPPDGTAVLPPASSLCRRCFGGRQARRNLRRQHKSAPVTRRRRRLFFPLLFKDTSIGGLQHWQSIFYILYFEKKCATVETMSKKMKHSFKMVRFFFKIKYFLISYVFIFMLT